MVFSLCFKFKMTKLCRFVVLVLVCITQLRGADSQSELCNNRCKCIDENSVTNVDCTNVFITLPVLYDNRSWFNDENVPYNYDKVVFKSSKLEDLVHQLPSSNLTYLDLTGNFIRKITDSCFAELQNMHTLILSDNELEILSPHVFKGVVTDGINYPLKSLKTLKLDNNRFHTLDDDIFEHLEQVLEVLDLSYNPFKVLDQRTTIAISSIIYLKELYLQYTDIKALPDNILHTPKYLKVLDLTGNRFTSVPEGLTDAHVLETLYLNTNPFVNITAENGFKNISTLKTLHLCDMIELEYIGARSLSALENLRELHICNNMKLWHIDPAAFSRVEVESEIWAPIKKLYLQNNQLSRIDFHLILKWNELEELDLRYNPWSCECENQWIADELMPIYIKLNETIAKDIVCRAPAAMDGVTFYKEHVDGKKMRCLDAYGNRPERDGTILIGVLIGLLIGIPLVLFIIFAYQRHWFGFCDNGPASFSRQFYKRTRSDEL
ncbi:hypothetical protein FQA39_LY16146 [Lamprigera yunnana]|nr:hypothetical protein FQA39_LY16146 [Lamprigera yunnana]